MTEPASPLFVFNLLSWVFPALVTTLSLALNTTPDEIKLRMLTGFSGELVVASVVLAYLVLGFVLGALSKALGTIVKTVLLLIVVATALLVMQEYGSLANLMTFKDWCWEFALRNLQKYGILKVSP